MPDLRSRQTIKPRKARTHPAATRIIEFLLAGGVVAVASILVTYINHQQDMTIATRNAAVAAVSQLSDLTSERRERAALVVSSIRRGGPEKETEDRKVAYDEAYVKWNSLVPGKLLEIRARLGLDYGSFFQDYVDGLTDTERLQHVIPDKRDKPAVSASPGLLNIMDSCVTQAYDAYRLTDFKDNRLARYIVDQCSFFPTYNDLVICVSNISRALYDAVIGNALAPSSAQADETVASCTPPEAAVRWSRSPPIKAIPPT